MRDDLPPQTDDQTAAEPTRFKDAVFHGDLDACAFLKQPVEIAYGLHRLDKNWINEVKTAGGLIPGAV